MPSPFARKATTALLSWICLSGTLLARDAAAACTAMLQYAGNGHWYQRCDDTMGWHDAADYCEAQGGYLATITSADEDSFAYSFFGTSAPVVAGMWLGGSDEASEGTFSWVTGEAFSYEHFDAPEPNNCSDIEEYIAYFLPPDARAGSWNDFGSSDAPPGSCGCGGCGAGIFTMSLLCEFECGDGNLDDGETCDDGAFEGGDGCGADCQLEACTAPPAGLLSWWPLDGALDDAESPRAFSFAPAADQPELVESFVREGLYFDSNTDIAQASHDAAFDVVLPGFTAEFWMRGIKNQPETLFVVLEKSHGHIDSTGWTFQGVSATGQINFLVGAGGGTSSNFVGPASTVDVLDGEYHHVAGTWDGTDVLLYVDGALQGSAPLATPFNNTRDLRIGNWWPGSRHFFGLIDELSIYSRALGAVEIADVAGAGSGGKCKDCAATGIEDGALCGNGTFCEGIRSCSDGVCGEGTPPDCDDDDACTDDVCDDEEDDCTHDDISGSCDDGSACTADRCDAVGGCVSEAAVMEDCLDALKSKFLYKSSATNPKDKLKWIWKLGAATTLDDLSDPTDDAIYELCVLGETSTQPQLLISSVIPASSTLWKPIGTKGFKYVDKLAASGGIKKVIAKSGVAGKAGIKVLGKGDGLDDPALPLGVAVTGLRVQLQNSASGVCWESSPGLDSIRGE